MAKFEHWGVKTRNNPEYGYASVWQDLVTIRTKAQKELPSTQSEFYDVSLGHQCNMECPFCYTSAQRQGKIYTNTPQKIKHLFQTIWQDQNVRPYQVAIGSEGEPTIHPEFIKVLECFYEHGVVPNYTTNGKILGTGTNDEIDDILRATTKYCGGVAVSVNKYNKYFLGAIRLLNGYTDALVNIHMICSDLESVDFIKEMLVLFDGQVRTFVILPLMEHGRSYMEMSNEAYIKLTEVLTDYKEFGRSKVAVGARMHQWLTNPNLPSITGIQTHAPEKFSKNLILDDIIRITPSSFNTEDTCWYSNYPVFAM